MKQVDILQHLTRFLLFKIFRFAYTLPLKFKAQYLVHLTTADTPLAFLTTNFASHMPAWSICHVLSNVSALREQPWFYSALQNGAPTWIPTEPQAKILIIEEQMGTSVIMRTMSKEEWLHWWKYVVGTKICKSSLNGYHKDSNIRFNYTVSLLPLKVPNKGAGKKA